MDLQDYGAYAQLMDTRDRIAGNPGLSIYEKVRDLGVVGEGLRAKPTSSRSSTFGDVLRTAIGGALGYGLGRGASSVLGLSNDASNSVALTGAMMGGLMGLTKSAEDRKTAFRVAFIKAAIDRGYFKQAFLAPLVLGPLTGLSGVAKRVGENVGSVVGSADAPDDIDTDIVRAKVEGELLRQEMERVEALRRNSILKEVLAKRREKR